MNEADAAVAAATRGLAGLERAGRSTSAAEYLQALAAELMRERRFELAAWEVYECGKPWREADGDVAEAIDFCEYYAAHGAASSQRPHGVDVPGEENRVRLRAARRGGRHRAVELSAGDSHRHDRPRRSSPATPS